MTSTPVRTLTAAELDEVSGGSTVHFFYPNGVLEINMFEKYLAEQAVTGAVGGGSGGKSTPQGKKPQKT